MKTYQTEGMTPGTKQPGKRRMAVAGASLATCVFCALITTTSRAGELEQFFYLPLNGANVADLTAAPEFPEQPFGVTPVNWFHNNLEGITNASTAYGSWLRGYLEAPVSGDYTFYLSADDSAEFYLSSDHQADHRQLVASVATAVPYGVYNWQPFQRSMPVTLERGRQYYFEIRHKSEGFSDHVQVGWLRPDDVLERPIPLHYVQRFVPQSYEGSGIRGAADIAPVIQASIPMGIAWENERVVLAPNVSATPPVYYQWFRNGVPLAGENLSSLDLGEVNEADSGTAFTLLAATAEGIALSDDWPLQVWNDATAPTILRALTSGMTNGFALTFSEPVDPGTATNAANYAMNLGIGITDVALLHGTNLTTVVVRTTSFPPAGIPIVTVNGVRDRAQPPNEITPGSTRAVSLADGRITLRYFGGVLEADPIGGISLQDLLNGSDHRFPYHPDLVLARTEMGIPNNFADNYAAQLIGFLVPPVTGEYRFWIASDDQGILYLSSDADPANKRAVAADPLWNSFRAYTTSTRRTLNNTWNNGFIMTTFPGVGPDNPVNDSLNTVGPIHLEAGRRYYIEAVMKEGGGGDNLDVAWQMPGGPFVVDGQAPIPGEFLAQWSGAESGDIVITNQPANTSVLEGRLATFRVEVKGTQPYTFQWFRNGVRIVDANEATYIFPARLVDGGADYTVRVRNDFSEVWGAEARLTVWPDATRPQIVRAFADQHFDKVTLWFDEPVTAATATNPANYTITQTDNGQPLAVTAAEVRGFSDGGYTNVLLRTATITSGVNYTVRTTGITDLSEHANATQAEDTAQFTGWVLSRGFALYERWDDVPLGGINAPAQYRNRHEPDVSTYLTRFESPQDVGENYLGRISGFFIAPDTGRHDFYMSSDENGELWMASDSSSSMAQTRVAFEPSWGNARSWTGTSDGRRTNGDNNTLGDPLPLLTMAAGEHRYLELLWKEGGGGDYAQATYSGPGESPPQMGSTSRLTGDVIAAWANPDAVTLSITDEPDDIQIGDGSTPTFSVSAMAVDWDGAGRPLFFQWQVDGEDIPGANSWTYSTSAFLAPRPEPYRVRCRVSSLGVETYTREALLRVMCDDCGYIFWFHTTADHTFHRVRIEMDKHVTMATATNLANFQIEGLTITSVEVPDPSAPGTRSIVLNTSPQEPGRQYSLSISGLMTLSYPSANSRLEHFYAFRRQPGGALREVWTNIVVGSRVSDLINDPRFPANPSRVEYLPALEAPSTSGTSFGQRVSGWLAVTNDAEYFFALAAADQAVFYLSTDVNPANKRAIATEPEWNAARDWNSPDRRINSPQDTYFAHVRDVPVNRSEHTTGPIHLKRGWLYYFELLHKTGGGLNHAAVTMWPAGAPGRANGAPPISDAQIWSDLPADEQIAISEHPADLAMLAGGTANFSALARARYSPVQYQWERDGVPIPGANQPLLNLSGLGTWANRWMLRCRVLAPPATLYTASARLTVVDQRTLTPIPSRQGGFSLVWGDDGSLVVLQATTNFFPTPVWSDREWSNQRNGLLELIVDPRQFNSPQQEFYRVIPAE